MARSQVRPLLPSERMTRSASRSMCSRLRARRRRRRQSERRRKEGAKDAIISADGSLGRTGSEFLPAPQVL